MSLTVGVNTIGTVDEADEYFAGRPHSTVWTGISGTGPEVLVKKEDALRISCRHLGSIFIWRGVITSKTQKLFYPRTGVVDDEGREIEPDAYPDELKWAQFELAAQWVVTDQLTPLASYLTASDPDGGAQVKKKELGPLKKEYFENAALMFTLAEGRMREKVYPLVEMYAAPYIISRKNSGEIRLVV